MRRAHVLLPVDLPPPAELAAAGAPKLARLVARADFTPRPATTPAPFEARLFARFGHAVTSDALPVAALTAALDGLDPATHPLRADPVCLRPDLVDVALLPGHPPGLAREEAEALIDEVNARLGEGGLRLALGASPLRWYVASQSPLAIRALPPRAIAGCGIREHLPTGPDRRRLLGWLTEVQFVLHASPVNAARAARGLPPVNSLWLWGGGVGGGGGTAPGPDTGATTCSSGPDSTPHERPGTGAGQWASATTRAVQRQESRSSTVFSDCALTRALARSAGLDAASPYPLAALADALRAKGMRRAGTLLVVDDPGPGVALDPAHAEAAWAAPLLAALRRGGLKRVIIDTPAGHHGIGRLGLLRFWRRP